MAIIYKIENQLNGKVYIGKTEKTIKYRWNRHLYYVKKNINRYLYDAIRKYGESNFSITEIESCDSCILNERERFWIRVYKSTEKEYGYNMAEGGEGGNIGEEGYKKIADKKRGVKHTQEHNDNISNALKGKSPHPMTDEINRKISNRLKELGCKPPLVDHHGENHPMYNKHHSQKSKDIIGAARKGKTYDEIFNAEISRKLKDVHRQIWTDSGNPNYVYFDITTNINEIVYSQNLHATAKQYGISYPTLLSKFKKEYGLTITQYRNEKNIII